jgi:transposase-like protein
LKARGLRIAPELAVADGALGFWKALDEVFPGTPHQRCWLHKIGNILNKVAKSIQPAVKQDLDPSRADHHRGARAFVACSIPF